MHTYIPTSIHAYIDTYINTYKNTYIYIFIYTALPPPPLWGLPFRMLVYYTVYCAYYILDGIYNILYDI